MKTLDVKSRAGRALIREVEAYLAFWAVVSEPTPLGKAETLALLRGRI